MEDKTIKVRCKWSDGTLELEKIYPVIEDAINGYVIKGDDNKVHIYAKDMFKKVEDVLMVECIGNRCKDSQVRLTIGNKYKLEQEFEGRYYVRNDNGNVCGYSKDYFKQVEPQKETKSYIIDVNGKEVRVGKGKFIKEYTVQEVLKMPKGTILKLFPYDESEKEIIVSEGVAGNKYLYYMDDDKCSNEAVMISSWIMDKPRFIKVEPPKPVSTAEAFKALDEGKIIESVYTHNKYKREKGYNQLSLIVEGFGYEQCESISSDEILDKWIIREDK